MAVPQTYDIKCILFKDGEPGRTSGKCIDLPSFIKMMQTPDMQSRLHNGELLGLLTHEGRSNARTASIPHADSVMRDPDLCNVLREVTVKDGTVYGYMDLTDTPAARRFKSLYRQGCRIGVSMSTDLMESDKFYITSLKGVDATLRPEFSTSQIVEANFSEEKDVRDINYDSELKMGNFSIDPSETLISQPHDFSVREYIRERQRTPSIVFRQRVRDVIMYSKLARAKTFQDNKSYLRRYLLDYVNEWITRALSDPKNDLNIALGLRLTEYCRNNRQAARDLQRYLRRARQQLNQQNAMSRDVQTNLNKSFSDVMNLIYEYINEKVGSKEKKL